MSEDWRKAPTEALMSEMAAMAISMISRDPELIERYKAELVEQKSPIPPDEVTEGSLRALDLALTMRAGDEVAATGRRHPLQDLRAELGSFTVPVPRIENGAEQAAMVMGLGGFLAEFMSGHPEAEQQFSAWLRREYPRAAQHKLTPGEYVSADNLLTMMAQVCSQIAQGNVGKDGVVTIGDDGDLDFSEAEGLAGI